MQKILRLHVANYGAQNAWYEGMTFQFTDPDTGEPCDVVVNLENGGGKTTLLGFIFSCFETRQERFLKHMQDRNHRFSEYFSKDGAPGVIVMEWSMPPKFAGAKPYRLVLGQIVSVRSAAEREDLERQFFAFEATAKLDFESVPAPGLGAEGRAHSMADFLKWAHEAQRIAGDFFITKVQEDWQKHLAARSIDVDMLRLQVDFSAQEGGIDASFLTFHNEPDFLRKFFALTLDAEKCSAVRQVVVGACDTLRRKPVLDRRLRELTRLSGVMKPFADAAGIYEHEREQRLVLERNAVGMRAALLAKAVSDEAAMSAHAQEADGEDKRVISSVKKAKEYEARGLTLRLLQLQRKLYGTEAAQTSASRLLRDSDFELRLIRGAKALMQVEETASRVADLQSLEEAEREGLKPARMQAEVQGALYRFALQRELERVADSIKAIQHREAAAQEKLVELRALQEDLNQRMAALNRRHGTLRRDEERFVEAHARLRGDRVFTSLEESSGEALHRHEQAFAETQTALEHASVQEAGFLGEERSHRAAAEAARLQAEGYGREKTQQEAFVAKGEAERERLSQLAVLRTAIEADVVDPDSPVLLAALEKLRSSDEASIATANVRIAEIEVNSKAIETTGVAGRSREVDEVVGKLHSAGVRSARAYNTYLADAVEEANRSRALVLSDPARFLGVAVASAELEHARGVLASASLKLARPVIVSVSALESPAKYADSIVVGPEDDSAYNRAAARAYAERLGKAMSDARAELSAYRTRNSEAIAAREQLRAYSDMFGGGRLDKARADIVRLGHERAAALERAANETEAAEQSARNAAEAKASAAVLSKKTSETEGHIRRMREFREEHEVPRSGRLQELKRIEHDLATAEDEQKHLRERFSQAEEEQRLGYEDRVKAESAAARVREDLSAITLYDTKFPAEQALAARPQTLDALRRLYGDAKSNLETEERQRLGVLGERLRAAREAAATAAKEFASQYADLDAKELQQRKKLNFDAAIASQEKVITSAREAEIDARAKNAEADTELKLFLRQNSKVAPATPEMETLKDTELARHVERAAQEVEKAKAESEAAKQAGAEARAKQARAERSAAEAKHLATTLTAALSLPDQIDAASAYVLEPDVSAQVNALIGEASAHRETLEKARGNAHRAFGELTRAASSRDFQEAEPELARLLVSNEFDAACADRLRLSDNLAERIANTEESIGRMQEDFDACVVELHALASAGIQNLSSAMGKRVPDAAPYVGGKSVIKLRANFAQVPNEARRDALRRYLDNLIDTGVVPAKGADLVAECVLRMHGKPLGLQVLKMVPDEDQQYVAVDQLKNSGGEGVTMAMFLYLVINQLRAETHAKLKKAGGGPLILDNPFAKATTPTLWRAQRLLAQAMDVQLIFATALQDYNTVGEFRRFIRLRKAGQNQKTGRWHLEHADLTLTEPAEHYA